MPSGERREWIKPIMFRCEPQSLVREECSAFLSEQWPAYCTGAQDTICNFYLFPCHEVYEICEVISCTDIGNWAGVHLAHTAALCSTLFCKEAQPAPMQLSVYFQCFAAAEAWAR